MAVGIYFGLRPLVGSEEVGWMCILGAAPFAACGFFKYHGMTAEQVAWAWFNGLLTSRTRLYIKGNGVVDLPKLQEMVADVSHHFPLRLPAPTPDRKSVV